MKITHTICALLAPTVTTAAAFGWTLPEPTIFAPAVADAWSPAPTTAPQLPNFELFRRQDQSEGDNTCGFVSGLSESSITCPNPTQICATNTYYGVHGCCDSSTAGLSSCVIPTTCIPSTALSTLCTDASCASNAAILKCTADAALAQCYEWLFVYASTTMTQHGCAASAWTSTALRSWGVSESSGSLASERTVTVTASADSTPTSSTTSFTGGEEAGGGKKKRDLGAIIGGTVAACIVLSIIAFTLFLFYRRRCAAKFDEANPSTQLYHNDYPPPRSGMMQYNPLGFHSGLGFVEEDHKLWQQQMGYVGGAVHRESNAVPAYPLMKANRVGVVEVDGVQRPVEAPT